MRTYSSLPRSSGWRSPLGSKFLRFMGYLMRLSEYTRMRSAMLKGLMVVLRGSENFLPLASMVQRPPSSSVSRSGRMRVMTPSSTVTFTMPPMQQLMNSCSAIYYASHFATSTRHELFASPGAFFDTILEGVSRLTHPPLSGLPGLPGSSGSYLAAAS